MDEQKEKLGLQNKLALDYEVKVLGEIIDKHEAVRERTIKYIYQFVTAIGVVAGFGFTAISFVKIIYLFILGEFLLFVAMAVGMVFVRKAFIDDGKTYAGIIDNLKKIMEERLKVSADQPVEDIAKILQEISQKEVVIFNIEPSGINSDLILDLILYSFISGAGFLLLSLLTFCF